jgi:hypothetical protein
VGLVGLKQILGKRALISHPFCPDIAIISKSIGGLPSNYPQWKCHKNKKYSMLKNIRN